MSQVIWDVIDPNTTSGTELATLLNDFKNAVVTGFSGKNRPANLQTGGYWVKTIDPSDLPLTVWDFLIYDGTNDIVLFSIDTATNNIIFGDISNSMEISRVSDDNFGPIFSMLKSRGSGLATQANDLLGEIDFKGKGANDIEHIQAQVQVFSADTVTDTEQGSYITVSTTEATTSALVEVLRILGDGSFGFGTQTPGKKIHINSNDNKAAIQIDRTQDIVDAAQFILRKIRSTGSGQVLNADLIGEHIFNSTDQNGAEIETAKISVEALENHTDTAQGVKLTISVKNPTENVYTEALKIQNGQVLLFGVDPFAEGNDIEVPAVDLLDDTVTRNLFSIDGDVYGSFEAKYTFYGRNLTNDDIRTQVIELSGVYDHNNQVWYYQIMNESVLSGTKLINLDYSNTLGKDLIVDYVNQIASANFSNGRIYGKLRRFSR